MRSYLQTVQQQLCLFIVTVDVPFDDLRIGAFKFMHFGEQRLGRVLRADLAFSLVYGLSVVVLVVHDVYRDAGLLFPGGDYGLVDMVTVHALPAVGRQQGRVDVKYPFGPAFNKIFRNFQQEAGQDDVVCPQFKENIGQFPVFSFIY